MEATSDRSVSIGGKLKSITGEHKLRISGRIAVFLSGMSGTIMAKHAFVAFSEIAWLLLWR